MPNVLIVSPVSDVAGGGIGLKRAFDAVGGEWKARHVGGTPEFFDYPRDAEWKRLDVLWNEADVVHVMELPAYVEHMPRKPTVVYHTGSRYRREPEHRSYQAHRIGAVEFSGSLDLCLLRGTPWVPIPADLDALAAERGKRRRGRQVTVSHAPTNRAIKSTDLILETLAGLDVDVELIEGVPWAECLRRKAATDVYVDELTLGYGMNALECWAMGIPVVSGIADPAFRAEAMRQWGELPFMEATPETIADVLRCLVASPGLRAEYAARGQAFAQRWHSQRAVVERWSGIYVKARAVWNRRHGLTRRAISSATQ